MLHDQGNSYSLDAQLFIYNCTQCASFVILYYDYFLTVRDEFDRYWTSGPKFTFGWTLFFLNRYLVVLGNIPVIFLYFWSWSESDRLEHRSRCKAINNYHQFLIVASQVLIASVAILRTHAIYGRSLRILILLGTVTLGVTVYGLRSILFEKADTYTTSDLTSSGCLLPLSQEAFPGLANGWTAHLFFDTLVFALTLYKSLTAKRAGFSILSIMLRDGTVYFGVMVLGGISIILSFHLCPDYLRGMTSTITNILSSTMISRLMLNLRDPHLISTGHARSGGGTITSKLVFETRPHRSGCVSQKSMLDSKWVSPVELHFPGGIYVLEGLAGVHETDYSEEDAFESFEGNTNTSAEKIV